MGREERSHVRKRKRGCLSGCLTRLILLLGAAALLFVGACVLGFVQNDPQTGKPSLTLQNIGLGEISLPEIDLSGVNLSGISGLTDAAAGLLEGGSLPAWAYGVKNNGLTVKTLRAGDGEAVLVCSDGYTMLLGAGGGSGWLLCGQLLLCGVKDLSAAVAMCSEDAQIGGMKAVLPLTKPDYLIYQDSQIKGEAYNAMISAAQGTGSTQLIVPSQGLTFSLGRATVTIVGPAVTHHADERDDGLSVRIDYGAASVLVMGTVTEAGEREIISSGANLDVDALICSRGGSDIATSAALVEAASPQIALMTGKSPANSVKVRLQKAGAQVYTMADNGVMTLYSDGQTLTIAL